MWVVGTNVFREPEYDRLIETLKKMEIPFVQVKTVPFSQKLLPADFDTLSYTGNIENAPDAQIDETQPIWVVGSYGLVTRGIYRGWKPCGWITNLCMSDWANKYPIVNPSFRYERLWDLKIHENQFIRPNKDSKTFSGEVFTPETWDNFLQWYEYSKRPIDPDEIVIVSSPKKITLEARYFIINQKIVTKSIYVQSGRVVSIPDTPEEADIFVKYCIERWTPNPAFVMDVGYTRQPDGDFKWRVIELNNFNAAGLYACDVQKIVFAVEENFF